MQEYVGGKPTTYVHPSPLEFDDFVQIFNGTMATGGGGTASSDWIEIDGQHEVVVHIVGAADMPKKIFADFTFGSEEWAGSELVSQSIDSQRLSGHFKIKAPKFRIRVQNDHDSENQLFWGWYAYVK